jgi:hypothetical protein
MILLDQGEEGSKSTRNHKMWSFGDMFLRRYAMLLSHLRR